MSDRILIVEDQIEDRRRLHEAVREEGFFVMSVSSVRDGQIMVERESFDLVLLDIVLPDGNGIDLCRMIREKSSVPVIMVTTRGETEDIVRGLEAGADDYITKPFRTPEVIARIRAQLRRSKQASGDPPERIVLGSLVVDSGLRDVVIDGAPRGLTAKEFEICRALAERAGRAVHRDTIFDEIWGLEEDRSEKILAVYIRRLREKLETDPANPSFILTVRGHGYRMAGSGS